MSKKKTASPHPRTIAATADHFLDVNSGAIVPPIIASSTYARDDRYEPINPANVYARDNNPTFVTAERTIASLENAEECLLFSSGMAAVAAVFYTLDTGAVVVLPQSMYWGVFAWTRDYCDRMAIHIAYYDPIDIDSIEQAMSAHARVDMLWLETPANPLMHVVDIAAVADIAHSKKALLIVDNTTPTPVHTQPLDLGADMVMHSATKALNGHSDVLAGALLTRESYPHWERIKRERHGAGAIIGSFEAWLLQRGLRTLHLRMERASDNSQRIAEFLESHPKIDDVMYPGLINDPGHTVALKQMTGGFGALMSFTVKGDKATALALASGLQLITSATSLGGVETLIEHRYSVEPPETKVPENLLRLAVGIEHIDDLLNDLSDALARLNPA